MRIFVLIFITIIFSSCSKVRTQKKSITGIGQNSNHVFLVDSLNNFQASGDLKLSFSKKRFRGKIDIILKERTNIELTVYNSLSMIIAYFRSDEDSMFIEIGEEKYTGCLTDTINSLSFFPHIPFNFSDLIRILTGRILKNDCLLKQIQLSKRNVIDFKCDVVTFFVVLSKNKLKVNSISITSSHGSTSWIADFSMFRNGFSENIEIKSNKSDYLLLKLNKIRYN